MSDRTEPRTAVVTGGASGIGRAIAERLAGDGTAVAILDLDSDAARAAAARIDGAIGLEADVTDRPRIEEVVAEVADRLGPPLILVNNAGLTGFVRFLEMSVEHWHERLDVNLTGTFHCCQVVLPHMVAAGWGRIVNISSSSTQSGTPRMAAYVAAKSGVGRRLGLPEDVAATCSFLCRDEAGYITGQTIGVNGGRNT